MKFHPSIAATGTAAEQALRAARQAAPSAAKAATIVTWVYAACFGLPAIPVAVYLLRNGRLPWLFDAFPMYGGPWYHSGQPERFAAQLDAFLVLMLVVSWGGWLLWRGSQSRSGARPRHDSRGGTVLVRLRTAHPAPARAGPRRATDRRVAAVAPLNHPGELGGLGDLAFLPPVANAAAGKQRSSSAQTTCGLRLRRAAGRQSASSRPRIAAARRCGGCWQRQRQHRTPRSARPGKRYRKGTRPRRTLPPGLVRARGSWPWDIHKVVLW